MQAILRSILGDEFMSVFGDMVTPTKCFKEQGKSDAGKWSYVLNKITSVQVERVTKSVLGKNAPDAASVSLALS